MESLPARVPHTLLPDLVSAFVPPDAPFDAVLELVITIKGEGIPAREFAAYLSLIDRLYGRLDPDGIRSYAHREQGRLRISEIHKSELEIIFRTLHSHQDAATFIVIAYILRCLPNILKAGGEFYKNLAEGSKGFADARKSNEEAIGIREDTRHKEIMNRYEETRIARENRKHIREIIWQDPELERLNEARKSQLIALADALVAEENNNLPAPIRFARHEVKDVRLGISSQRENQTKSEFMDELGKT